MIVPQERSHLYLECHRLFRLVAKPQRTLESLTRDNCKYGEKQGGTGVSDASLSALRLVGRFEVGSIWEAVAIYLVKGGASASPHVESRLKGPRCCKVARVHEHHPALADGICTKNDGDGKFTCGWSCGSCEFMLPRAMNFGVL